MGRRLAGKYTVERSLGVGDAGPRYLALQGQPAREVAVKVLAPRLVRNEAAMVRFDREATRLSALRHPNVVAILDHGRDDGRAWLVTEYIGGESLAGFLARRGRLAVEEFVPIAAQILKGIGHAHTRELLVRDVEPTNVMLCERKGRANFVKILDFGLAELLAEGEPITGEHAIGSVAYLAPEVLRGEMLDLRVDVYAIGVLFHLMLAGRLPFDGSDSAAIFQRTLAEPAPRLGNELGLPEGLVRLVQRCLAKHPDDRPADANAVVEELIDAVPAPLFRLPRATASTVPAGSGNTGMIEIVGRAAVSGPHETVAREDSSPLIDTQPMRSKETVPSTSLALGPITAMPMRKPAFGLVALAVAAGALMAVLGAVLAAAIFADDDASSAVAVGGVIAAHDDVGAATEGLAHAKHLIDEGQLELAADVLDGVRELVVEAPALQAKLERTDRALLVAKLMNTAARFEGEGDIAAALSTYRDVLEADPTHAVARSRLSRLGAKSDDDAVEVGVAYGDVSIDANPDADLVIDGQPAGSTPFEGRLPVGKHAVRMTARGHQPWEGTVEIADEANDPIRVRLHAKASVRSSKPVTPKASVAAPTETKAVVDPGRPAEQRAEKREVFLPNKSDRGGGVFLPTKE